MPWASTVGRAAGNATAGSLEIYLVTLSVRRIQESPEGVQLKNSRFLQKHFRQDAHHSNEIGWQCCDFCQVCWTTSWTQPDGIRSLKCLHRTMARSSQGWRLEWQEEGRGHIWSCRGYLWTRKQNYLPLLASPRPVNIVLEYLMGYGHKESKSGKVCAIWKEISPEHTDLSLHRLSLIHFAGHSQWGRGCV